MVTPVKTEGAWTGLNSTEEIIADLRDGKMVVILDDEDRENEGDLIMAATKVVPDDINFMARYGRGLICLTLTRARCEQLRLPLMVSELLPPEDFPGTITNDQIRIYEEAVDAVIEGTVMRGGDRSIAEA